MTGCREVRWLSLPTDHIPLRKGDDRLAGLAQEHLKKIKLDGGLFVFFNRRRNRVELLSWDLNRYAPWTKARKVPISKPPRTQSRDFPAGNAIFVWACSGPPQCRTTR
ncbi:MAG: IS66 family insertion sequence element accessory protein TnpB [Planctomycetaceae bacterium]|nr:IS66 family insertion sequence element accessory protein TnpB [Planctomycetaceae bacterium]